MRELFYYTNKIDPLFSINSKAICSIIFLGKYSCVLINLSLLDDLPSNGHGIHINHVQVHFDFDIKSYIIIFNAISVFFYRVSLLPAQ